MQYLSTKELISSDNFISLSFWTETLKDQPSLHQPKEVLKSKKSLNTAQKKSKFTQLNSIKVSLKNF